MGDLVVLRVLCNDRGIISKIFARIIDYLYCKVSRLCCISLLFLIKYFKSKRKSYAINHISFLLQHCLDGKHLIKYECLSVSRFIDKLATNFFLTNI